MPEVVCWIGKCRDGKPAAWLSTPSAMLDQFPELDAMIDTLYEGVHFYLPKTDGFAIIDVKNSSLSISNYEQIVFSCEVTSEWATFVENSTSGLFYWVLTYEEFSPDEVRGLDVDEIYEKHEEGEELFVFSIGEMLEADAEVDSDAEGEYD